MGQIRHGSATTTHAVRTAIQRSQVSAAQLSRIYGINPKTVLKWPKRTTVEDLKTGPSEPRSTVLSKEEDAIVITSLPATASSSLTSPRTETDQPAGSAAIRLIGHAGGTTSSID